MTQATIDLIWWIGGGVVAGVGLALLVWALIGDRSRGRKRCPKCWYDMSSTPRREEGEFVGWVCPECGRRTIADRDMFRSRRQLWKLALALTLMFGGIGVPMSRVPRTTLIRATPTPILVWIAHAAIEPSWSAGPTFYSDVYWILFERKRAGAMSDSQAFTLGMKSLRSTFRTPERWPAGLPVPVFFDAERWWWAIEQRRRLSLLPDRPGLSAVRTIGWMDQRGGYTRTGTELSTPSRWEIGALPEGIHSIDFDVIVEKGTAGSSNSSASFKPDSIVWRDRIKRSIQIVATLEELSRPVRSDAIDRAVREGLDLKLVVRNTPNVWATVTRPIDTSLTGVTLGITIELCRDGEVVDRTTMLIEGSPPIKGRWKRGFAIRGREIRAADLDDPAWTVRVRGDGPTALLQLTGTSHWAGSFELALKDIAIDNEEGLALERYTPPAIPLRGVE